MGQPHNVTFGKIARTLVYEDPECRFVFTFEQDRGGITHLEHHVPQVQYAPRYRIAFEHTKEFLEARGHQLKVHGDYWISKKLTASSVSDAYPLGTVTQYRAAYLQHRCRKVFSYPHPRTLQSWGECLALGTVDCPCRTRKLDKSRIRRMQHPIRTCAGRQLRRLQRNLCSNS